MKTINNLSFLLATCLLLCLSACHEQEEYDTEIKDGKLLLNYQVNSGIEVSTYAVNTEANEIRIDDVYTLFFRASTHTNPNAYVGYTRSTVSNPTSEGSGSIRVSLPDGEKVDDAWQLLVLANFDTNAFLDSELSVADLLANKVSTKTFEEARLYLMASLTNTPDMGATLAMSADTIKEANTTSVRIQFKRRVARIDVNNSATSNFKLTSVQLWNARTHGYMFDRTEGQNSVPNGITRNYDEIVTVADGDTEAKGKLYAFPSFVTTTDIYDEITTCLIIGGKYDDSPNTTYYRVNACPAESQQLLKANSAYTIDIKKVNSAGETTPEKAYKAPLKIEYTINEWDDAVLGIYVFDKDGNGLAVSQRKVIFSEDGGQSVDLKVFMIKSQTHPIAGTWEIGPLKETDASTYFSAEKVTRPDGKDYLPVGTLTDNTTTLNREATFDVTWGDISIPITLVQLTPNAVMGKIIIDPRELDYEMPSSTKEISVQLQGSFKTIKREDIATTILYKDNGTEEWLTLTKGSTADQPEFGLFYFNVTASENTFGTTRLANIKFAVTQDFVVMTSQASVRQTSSLRFLSIHLLEKDKVVPGQYNNKGNMLTDPDIIKGLPEEIRGTNHLHFALVRPDQVKYEMKIRAPGNWTIVRDQDDLSRDIQITVKTDEENTFDITVNSVADSGRDGRFYIEYQNGVRDEFYVHQHGVFSTLGEYKLPGRNENNGVDNDIYYYGLFKMNNKLWLDRNLGAIVGQDGLKGYYTNWWKDTTEDIHDPNGKGLYFIRAQANSACPIGFRLPKSGSNDGEWYWVHKNMKAFVDYNPSVGCIWYVIYATDPTKYWALPPCGRSNVIEAGSGHYLCYTKGYLHFGAPPVSWDPEGECFLYPYFENSYGHSVRCVQE